jgi:hypothetical protein
VYGRADGVSDFNTGAPLTGAAIIVVATVWHSC